ncbi:hypothetical protein [Streptomyces phaeochromogenes]|uniref:hypothetical protein n=1 Tax=Streptomyces phaeochromogenes TaxID=1923 RepID=UPI00386C1487|nr:hypothetical protein OHB08_04375 [Streptomyces phaeochromogenes]
MMTSRCRRRQPAPLVADPGTCRSSPSTAIPYGSPLGVTETTAVACLIHPEHGGTGIAPGRCAVRQRERASDRTAWSGSWMIAD